MPRRLNPRWIRKKAFEYIAGVGDGGKIPEHHHERLRALLRHQYGKAGRGPYSASLSGDSLNLQTAQNADNGFSELEKALLRYIAAGLGCPMNSFPVIIHRSVIPVRGIRQ